MSINKNDGLNSEENIELGVFGSMQTETVEEFDPSAAQAWFKNKKAYGNALKNLVEVTVDGDEAYLGFITYDGDLAVVEFHDSGTRMVTTFEKLQQSNPHLHLPEVFTRRKFIDRAVSSAMVGFGIGAIVGMGKAGVDMDAEFDRMKTLPLKERQEALKIQNKKNFNAELLKKGGIGAAMGTVVAIPAREITRRAFLKVFAPRKK